MSARFRIEFEKDSGQTGVLSRIDGFLQFHLVAIDVADPTYRYVFRTSIGDIVMQYEHWLKKRGEAFEAAAVRWSISRLEELLSYGNILPRTLESQKLALTPADIEALVRMAGEKKCDYQIASGRDLYCVAASRKDETIVGSSGLRHVAPTSRPVCQECNLPDTDIRCSHLSHPSVLALVSKSEHTRRVVNALCEIGRHEIDDPSKCCAGGHQCWTRIVDSGSKTLPATVFSLRELPIALDFLSMVWKQAFGAPLIQLRSVEKTSALAFPCSTQDELRARLGDLNDLFKLMDIPEQLLPSVAQGKIDKSQTYSRIEACLSSKILDDADRDCVGEAILDLKALTTVRNKLTHGGSEIVAALERLGVDYPITDHGKAWDQIRAKVAGALTTIRSALQATYE